MGRNSQLFILKHKVKTVYSCAIIAKDEKSAFKKLSKKFDDADLWEVVDVYRAVIE